MRRLLPILICAIGTACISDARHLTPLPASVGATADSIAHAYQTYLGLVPQILSTCGPRRLLVVFRDAPGDVRERRTTGPNGATVWVDAIVEQGRAAFAEEMASIALSTLSRTSNIDTISVRLLRASGSSVEFDNLVERDPITQGVALHRIQLTVTQCPPVT
jgi:hypothetical protein